MSSTLLETHSITRKFGEIVAVDSVSIEVSEGEILALIGPNGAGKTTFFNLLTATLQPTEGEISFKGETITDDSSHKVASRGITRSYQITNFFPALSVLENVRLAAQADRTGFSPSDLLRHSGTLDDVIDDSHQVLDRLGLETIAEKPAQDLAYGQQRHLEMAIAFATDPDLLLLDEPTAGLAPDETNSTIEVINEMAQDTTIIIIEHDMNVVMGVADRIAVMHSGSVLTEGSPEDVRQNEEVQNVYLKGGNV